MSETSRLLEDLNKRSKEVFQRVVESYLDNGEPIGSRTLSRSLSEKVSAATVRNVMQDLEHYGLLNSPHVSAGRIPTELGLRLFVDGLLEVGDPDDESREVMDATVEEGNQDVEVALDRVGSALSAVTKGASLVLTPKHEAELKHLDFVSLAHDRALVVLVFNDGHVENRLFTPPPGYTRASMREAANFLNSFVEGKTISELRRHIALEIERSRREVDNLAGAMVESGLVMWAAEKSESERLIVRGRANLLQTEAEDDQLDRIRHLFDDLERKRDIAAFLELVEEGDGVRIFIGSENKLFSLSGSSLVVSPYMNAEHKIVGAVGVIGPTRLNYGRIVPIVSYTAQLIGRMISDRS
ncbi:MAG: heat-inducible transcriptional repressor HrcA [Aestuariivita sp.]|nr:heat-inducible transcriptional repressor HrcA [Aestuariivita sp.]